MNNLTIWTEKYRPSSLNDIIGQTKIIERIKAFIARKNMPHLLLAGPAGTGKTTTALAIAQDLFGETWKQNFLELNASDERGIDVVRNTIKDFSRIKSMGDVPFKIIYLDECDSLTKEAQQALRRTMENFVESTRFILSCNVSSKIIDPIQSRCTVFRFKLLHKKEVIQMAQNIAQTEGSQITESGLEALYDVSNGDLRKLINIMQSCSAISSTISDDLVYEIVSAAKPKEIKEVLTLILSKDFVNARKRLLDVMLNHGLSGLDVVKQIQKEVWDLEIPNEKKVNMIEKCGEIEFRLVEGSDEFVQLEALLASFIK